MRTLTSCLGCKTPLPADLKPVHSYSDRAVIRCADCGMFLINPQYDASELKAHYDSTMYSAENAWQGYSLEKTLRRDRPLHELSLKLIERESRSALTDKPRLLDYGCGPGLFLKVAKDRGWQVDGIEFNPRAVDSAKQAFGIEIFEQDKFPYASREGSYDVVTAWEVLEHSPQPREMMQQIFRLVRPGGFAWLAFPNPLGLEARLKGARWQSFSEPTHLSFFTMHALERMLGEIGFVDLKRRYYFGGHGKLWRRVLQYGGRALHLGTETRVVARRPR